MTAALLQAALGYARLGVTVIPLEPRGKRPALRTWRAFQERAPTEAELYKAYKAWADEAGAQAFSQKAFSLELTAHGLEKRKGGGGAMLWRGIGLRATEQSTEGRRDTEGSAGNSPSHTRARHFSGEPSVTLRPSVLPGLGGAS
jgi:phage/plasmid-associated DNA primase